MQIQTQSSIILYQKCPRAYYYRYVICRAIPRVSAAMSLGTAMHEFLSGYHGANIECREYPTLDDEYENAKLAALIAGYKQRYTPRFVYEARALAEQEFISPVPNSEYKLAGKIDLYIETSPTNVMLVEHKTTGMDISAGSLYWHRLEMDLQLGLYSLALASLGKSVDATIYNVIATPKLRPKKNETPEEFRRRIENDIADNPDKYYRRGTPQGINTADTLQNIQYTLMSVDVSEKHGINGYYKHTKSCVYYNTCCEYFPVCNGECGIDSDRYVNITQHQELESCK